MKKIKVLHLTSTRYGIGGVERLLLDMSDKYDFSRFDIAYCNLFCDADGDGVFPTELKKRGLNYFTISGRRWSQVPKMVLDLARLIRRERFDVLHLHMMQATIVGGLSASLQNRTRTVLTKHYTDALVAKNAILKRSDVFFTNQADGVIAISDYVRDDMVRLGTDERKIERVHNGIDLQRFDGLIEGDPSIPLPRAAQLIGTVGSLTSRKGHKVLIDAMPTIIAAFPGAHLLIIGEGPEESSLREQIETLGITGQVTIAGYLPNVAPVLAKLDLYVHPSINEPFGIAVLEAMAARKTVIATAVEGLPEIVVNGETGYLFESGDQTKLAELVVTTLRDPEKTRSMGNAGRLRVEENFGLDRTVRGYERMYESVVAR